MAKAPIKSFWTVVILILVIALGVAFALYHEDTINYLSDFENSSSLFRHKKATPTPTPTITPTPVPAPAGWKTYKNPLGYSIKYPHDWIYIIDSISGDVAFLSPATAATQKKALAQGAAKQIKNDLLISVTPYQCPNSETDTVGKKQATLGNQSAYSGIASGKSISYIISTSRNDQCYLIATTNVIKKILPQKTEQTIINTFQFTN